MYYSETTLKAWRTSSNLFDDPLVASLEKLNLFVEKYSPLSDLTQILKKEEVKLKGISMCMDGNSRYPLRNVIRLIARLSKERFNSRICGFHIQEMKIRCDTFEGHAIIDFKNGDSMELEYRWKWTDFDGGIDFDKFTKFILKTT